MTVSFSGVEQATILPPGDTENAPPFISGTIDPPTPGVNLLTALGECDVAATRPTCIGWNRDSGTRIQEWELFPPVGVLPTDGLVFAMQLAAGQAGGGFTFAPFVYSLPTVGNPPVQAGSYCFPCAEFGDNTGLVLTLICTLDNGLAADLTLFTRSDENEFACRIVTWDWNFFSPDAFNTNFTQGSGRRAEVIEISLDLRPQAVASLFPCWTPRGRCINPEDDFGDCRDDEGKGEPEIANEDEFISRFYDTYNCFWNAVLTERPILKLYRCGSRPPKQNDYTCDTCTIQNTHVVHADFEQACISATEVGPVCPVSGKRGLATTVNDPVGLYVEDNYWLLTDAGGNSAVVNTLASGDVELSFPCFYEVYLRYRFVDEAGTRFPAGEVRIFNVAGAGGAFVATVDHVFELSDTSGDLDSNVDASIDGPHNTDLIDGKLYEKLGVFQMTDVNDTFVRIEVDGPFADGEAMIFDDLVLRRL